VKGDRSTAGVEPISPQELMLWCADRLARFKVPKYVRFVTEFPMTASGKIQKYRLREEHQKILTS
jgi:fatty-acyl-CoA synthase